MSTSRRILQFVEIVVIGLVLAVPLLLNSCARVEYVERLPGYQAKVPPGGDDLQQDDCSQYVSVPELKCDMGLSI